MEILRTIALYAHGKEMPFIVIGGHAINTHGFDRHTGDIDLLVPRSHKAKWLELMEQLRYKSGQNTEIFARFRPESLANWPIDLMFVDDKTFEIMNSSSVKAEFGLIEAKVASMEHLITLKIHALKTFQEDRDDKDFFDLLFLVRRSKMADSTLLALCEKYASPALFHRVKGALNHE